MTERIRSGPGVLLLALIAPILAMSQGQIQTLVVNGHPGSVPVTQLNGKNYVEVEALARVANGSLSFNGNQMALTLPAAGSAQPAPAPASADDSGFSKEFMRAGIEQTSTLREWHSVLANAIQNQVPITQDWLAPYQAQAQTNLRLAQAAATTSADQSAAQFLVNLYQKMKQLDDKYVARRANMNYIAPDALDNDPLNQSIVACGRALGAMAASRQFVDDAACH